MLAAQSVVTASPPIRPTVYRLGGVGLTEEVKVLLKNNPLRQFTLREIMAHIRATATPGEVQSVLHKLVHVRNCVIQGRMDNPLGRRKCLRLIVKSYKWRLPGDE